MTEPNRSSARCLPVSEWPSIDQVRLRQALTPGDALDPGGVASRWSPATLRKRISGYGRFLSWLCERGELDPASTPESRITRERATAYLDHLRQVNHGHTIQCRIQELGDAMRALAPDGDWRWILRAAGRLRASTTAARDKHARLRPIEELIALGIGLMDRAEKAEGLSDLDRAVLYRDGLMVAFLGFNPMRLRNLASLEVGVHLVERDNGFWLPLTAVETKGRRSQEGPVAARLVEPIRHYLRHHRLLLLGRDRPRHGLPANRLWIAETGAPLSEESVGRRITKWTASAGKPAVSPHLFRTCAATTVAIRKPESVEILPAVLGHSTPRMAERHYNLAGSVEAARAYSAMLEERYRALAAGRRGPKRGGVSSGKAHQPPDPLGKVGAKD